MQSKRQTEMEKRTFTSLTFREKDIIAIERAPFFFARQKKLFFLPMNKSIKSFTWVKKKKNMKEKLLS